jgi:hypothetical protein
MLHHVGIEVTTADMEITAEAVTWSTAIVVGAALVSLLL